MPSLTKSHLFRTGLIFLGLLLTPICSNLTNSLLLSGRLSETFEQIQFLAWFDLAVTGAIPFILLSIWSYLLDFLPEQNRHKNQVRAHSIAVLVTALFTLGMTSYFQVEFWSSTDPNATGRFFMAPFATVSLQVLLYVVVYSMTFKVGSVGKGTKKKK